MSDSNLVQIARFFDEAQAHIIRGKLESHDIPCFIFDQFHSGSAWHLTMATGGFRLMIPKSEFERALEVLEEDIALITEKRSAHQPLIKKPYLKTILGTIMGLMAGAPSIRSNKNKDKE